MSLFIDHLKKELENPEVALHYILDMITDSETTEEELVQALELLGKQSC